MSNNDYYQKNPIDVSEIGDWIYDVLPLIYSNRHKDRKQRILDVGCGEGTYSSFFKNENTDVWGIEISNISAEIAKRKMDQVIIQDAEKPWDVPSNYFDTVTMLRYLEHVFDYNNQLEQAYKSLTDNGELIIYSPSWSILEKMRLLFGYVPECVMNIEHIRQFNQPILYRILINNGFLPIKCIGYGFRIPKLNYRLKIFEKIFPNSCPCLIIKAVKQ